MVKFTTTKQDVAGPSSSLGIMRFFDTDMAGPKITPEFVIVLCVIFSAIIFGIKLMQ